MLQRLLGVALLGAALLLPAAPAAAADDVRSLLGQGWTYLEAGSLRKAEEAFMGAFDTPEGRNTAEVYYAVAAIWWERRNAMASYMWLSDAQKASRDSYTWNGGPDSEWDRRIGSRRRFIEKNFTVIKLRSPKRGKPLPPLSDPPPADPLLREFTDGLSQVVDEGVEAKVAVQWVLLPNGTYWIGEDLVTLGGGELDPARADSWELPTHGGKAKKAYEERVAAIGAGNSMALALLGESEREALEAERADEEERLRQEREEADRVAEARRAEEERKAAEEQARADEAAAAEAERVAEEQRRADEEERRTDEDQRAAEEDQRQAEADRAAEEQRKADEEAARQAETLRRQKEREAEAERQAVADEEARQAEEARQREEGLAELRKQDEARADEEARLREERLAAEEAARREAADAEELRRAEEREAERLAAEEAERTRSEDEWEAARVRMEEQQEAEQAREDARRADRGTTTGPSGDERDRFRSRKLVLAGGIGGATVTRLQADGTTGEVDWSAGGEGAYLIPLKDNGLALGLGVSYTNVPVSGCSQAQTRASLFAVQIAPRIPISLGKRAWLSIRAGAHIGGGGTWPSDDVRDSCAVDRLANPDDRVAYGVRLSSGPATGRLSYAELGWRGASFVVGPDLEVAALFGAGSANMYLGAAAFLRHDQVFAIVNGDTYHFRDEGSGLSLFSSPVAGLDGKASMARFQFGVRGVVIF
ncbi:MAG: hypothetical protein GY898_17990 [Proteobacteria bacterium]|nr:hypothetical protein [Pseudomonadota bacterium]